MKKILFTVMVFLSTGIFAENLYYMMNYKAENVQVKLEVNGIPVLENDLKDAYNTSDRRIASHLKKGDNVVTLEIGKKFDPKKGASSFKVYISKTPAGGYSDEGEKVFSEDWTEEKSPIPFVKKYEFNIADFPQTYLDNAQEITLSAADKTAMTAIINKLGKAWEKKEAAVISEISLFRTNEMQRVNFSEETNLAELKKEIANTLKSMPSFKLKPVKQNMLKFRLIAGNRLVQVTALNGKEPISMVSKEGTFSIPVIFGKVNNQWTLVK